MAETNISLFLLLVWQLSTHDLLELCLPVSQFAREHDVSDNFTIYELLMDFPTVKNHMLFQVLFHAKTHFQL